MHDKKMPATSYFFNMFILYCIPGWVAAVGCRRNSVRDKMAGVLAPTRGAQTVGVISPGSCVQTGFPK